MSHPKGYSRLQITLHWLVGLFVVMQFVLHNGISDAWEVFVKGGTMEFSPLVIGHVVAGNLIFLMVAWRLILRIRRGVPAPPENDSGLQKLIARAVHVLLYTVLLVMPISGAVALFGNVQAAAAGHNVAKGVLMALILLHILGALFNQFVQKNGLIGRMMKAE